jgi:hypothetical protein
MADPIGTDKLLSDDEKSHATRSVSPSMNFTGLEER